ncbi:hypothetical protein NLX74_17420 [Paenibacillus sp. MZ03-122A]|nr:hypothetical protein [Paenibacillus sp. MZ03-122A]
MQIAMYSKFLSRFGKEMMSRIGFSDQEIMLLFFMSGTWLNQCIIKKAAPTGLPECRESPEDFSTLLFLYGGDASFKTKIDLKRSEDPSF